MTIYKLDINGLHVFTRHFYHNDIQTACQHFPQDIYHAFMQLLCMYVCNQSILIFGVITFYMLIVCIHFVCIFMYCHFVVYHIIMQCGLSFQLTFSCFTYIIIIQWYMLFVTSSLRLKMKLTRIKIHVYTPARNLQISITCTVSEIMILDT